MNWRPIETAPKDGTAILAYPQEPYTPIEIVRWHERDNAWIYGDFDHGMQATHWMPLPPPPSTEPAPQDTGEKWGWHEIILGHLRSKDWFKDPNHHGEVIVSLNADLVRNLLAGHDLSQVVVVPRAVLERAKLVLQKCSDYPSLCEHSDLAHEALASLDV